MVKPSAEFNFGHFLYLLCRDAIPGMVVSAAVNMAISYGETAHESFLFPFVLVFDDTWIIQLLWTKA